MDINIIIQYVLVGLCLAAIVIWIVLKLVKFRKKEATGLSSCGCCSLGDSCKKTAIYRNKVQADDCCSSPDGECQD